MRNRLDEAENGDWALQTIRGVIRQFESDHIAQAVLITALVLHYRKRGLKDLEAANEARNNVLALWSTVNDDD